jgi:hypothetical protein
MSWTILSYWYVTIYTLIPTVELIMFTDAFFFTATLRSDSSTLSTPGFAFQPGSLDLDSELFAVARLDALDSFAMHVLWTIVILVFCCN